nr:dihydrolipoamide acetyltransferase family protein [Microlunatus flavus]
MPDPGEGLVEAEIITWRVAVGDEIKINDIVVEIETSKSLVELPSPYAGTVTALLADEGQMVDVGAPIIAISDGVGDDVPAEPADSAEPPEHQPTGKHDFVPPMPGEKMPSLADGEGPSRVANLVGYGPRTTEARRRPRRSGAPATHAAASSSNGDDPAAHVPAQAPVSSYALPAEPEAPAAPTPEPEPDRHVTVLAKPPVRKLARDRGVDLTTLTGSGPGGVVTREDVDRASRPAPAATPDATAAPAARTAPAGGPTRKADPDRETRVPIKGVRKATAEAMVRSAFTAPHVTEWVTCDVTATMELVERLRDRREFRGVKISPLLVVAKAVCVALSRVPQLNAYWDEATQEIATLHYVNLGIAAATPRGLVVPNLKGADEMTLLEMAQAINAIVSTAREGRTSPSDMAGGTFSITNVGTFGVDAGTPILNPGEAGILCVGQIARRPWVVGSGRDERIEPRWVTTLAVSFDHRLVDGEQGSVFLSTVAQILTDPGLGLLF